MEEKIKPRITGYGLQNVLQNVLHNMSAPPRTKFTSHIHPIGSGPILFNLEDLLKDLGIEINSLSKKSSIFKITGVTSQENVDKRAKSLPKFLISVLPQDKENDYCKDLELTLAILSRRTGKFFMASRKPDYSVGFLLEEKFRVDNF